RIVFDASGNFCLSVWQCIRSDIRVMESGVAQTISKRIQRLACEVTISTAFHGIVIEGGQLVYRFIKRDRQPAGGIVVSGKSPRDSSTAFLSAVPRLQNGRGALFGYAHGKSAPV